MKKYYKSILSLFVAIILFSSLNAANFKNLKATITQPDGTVIGCYSSGDEFFNYLHDASGYTIIQGQDGWYYYAILDNTAKVVPSQIKVGTGNPAKAGISKGVKISEKAYKAKVEKYLSPLNVKNTKAPSTGSFNNIVIYIRFADDAGMTNTRQTYLDMFTGTGGLTYSVQEYFESVSYDQLTVNAVHFPDCAPTTNLSYQDSYNRNYYQPYNATTNPAGYVDDDDSRVREHTLLKNAINSLKTLIEAELTAGELDMDNNGDVDNISFIVSGDNDTWSDLLWAHRWALYTYDVTINGKYVWDYNFQPESQSSSKTTCHELFHCIGSPDLYHYYYNTDVSPASYWDIMEYGSGSMTAYMKEQIGGWITIPEITTSGNYSLNPLASATNNAYKIAFPNSTTEFLVLEFRKKTGVVESKLSASADEGLLIYRINTEVSINEGNRNGPPDMLWVYRPNGDTDNDGDPWNATFSSTQGRTTFNAVSNPECHLSDDATWGEVSITNVGAVGSTISFDVTLPSVGYDVTFNVSDGTTPLENAEVTFNSTTQYTNPSGQTVFNGVSVGSDLPYTVTFAGYDEANSTVDVIDQNVIENVVMEESIPTTKLQDSYCGSNSSTTYYTIYCDQVAGAEDYEFRFTNSGISYDDTLASGEVWGSSYGYRNYLKIMYLNDIVYGVTYDVQVRTKVSGTWGDFGTVCQFTLNGTKLKDAYCGGSYSTTNTIIYADGISGATNYEFQFTNTTTLDVNNRTTESVWGSTYAYRNYLKLCYIPDIQYGYTYDVQIRALVGGVWSEYWTVCQLTLGGTKLRDDFCDVIISNSNTLIYCDGIIGSTNYEFRFTNTVTHVENTRTTAYVWGAYAYRTYMRLYYIPGLSWGSTYDVDVRAYINGSWTPYGQVCQLTYGPGAKNGSMDETGTGMFMVESALYPNPFNSNATLVITGETGMNYDVYVSNITGKIIGEYVIETNKEYEIGEDFDKGVYLLMIFGNENMYQKTIKFIKN
ncbi:MAG: M6 family metalloprotease domain-containing protein [Bacteroidota bacterium]